jgi:uncharacterized membrane protein
VNEYAHRTLKALNIMHVFIMKEDKVNKEEVGWQATKRCGLTHANPFPLEPGTGLMAFHVGGSRENVYA